MIFHPGFSVFQSSRQSNGKWNEVHTLFVMIIFHITPLRLWLFHLQATNFLLGWVAWQWLCCDCSDFIPVFHCYLIQYLLLVAISRSLSNTVHLHVYSFTHFTSQRMNYSKDSELTTVGIGKCNDSTSSNLTIEWDIHILSDVVGIWITGELIELFRLGEVLMLIVKLSSQLHLSQLNSAKKVQSN